MRIAIFGKYPPIQGGVSSHTFWLTQALARAGHDVTVLTNAPEVEANFRETFLPGDERRLETSGAGGSVRLVQTTDSTTYRTEYIPMASPFVSKLIGLGLRTLGDRKPDIILGWYFEPFGIAATAVGRALRLPVVIRHAGSDLARLSAHPDLRPAYQWMLKEAAGIFVGRSQGSHDVICEIMGAEPKRSLSWPLYLVPDEYYTRRRPIDLDQFAGLATAWLKRVWPGDADSHYADVQAERPVPTDTVRIVLYGKVGHSKGNIPLLRALGRLAASGRRFTFLTVSSGWLSHLREHFRELTQHAELQERTWILPPLAPWRMREVVAASHMACFLEHDFAIKTHAPCVPYEVLAAGPCLVCSAEIWEKLIFGQALIPEVNAIRVSNPSDVAQLEETLRALIDDPERAAIVGANGWRLMRSARQFLMDDATAAAHLVAQLEQCI